jgi:hypothetical protein
MEESSEWTCIVKSTEDNSADFCKSLEWTLLSSAHYGTILKVGAQAGQSGVVNETSVELVAQDDNFRK